MLRVNYRRWPGRRWFGAALLAGTALYQPSWAQPARPSFNIPAEPVGDALIQFGQQAGLQASADVSVVRGLRSTPISGAMTWQQALSTLLAGTGLIYQVNGSMVSVERLPTDNSANAVNLPPVQVEGARTDPQRPSGPGVGYVATRSATATKSDTPIMETPQAISTVTRQQMDDQGTQTVRQALRYSSGVDVDKNGINGDAFEQIYGRGFLMEEYLDGLRLPNNTYNVLAIDPYDLERIEVMHGPASVLYGQAYPGGMVNLASKLPTDTGRHEVFLQGGSPAQISGGVDLSGRLDQDGQWLGRIVASGLDGDTQVSNIDRKRISVAPSLTWKPDGDTSFTILGRYQSDPEAGYYNNLPAVGTMLYSPYGKIPTKLNVGDPNFQEYNRTEESIGYLFDHRFNDVFSVHQSLRYTHDSSAVQNVFGSGLSSDGRTLSRYSFVNHTGLDQFDIDTNGQAKFGTGPLTHTVTAGLDYQRIFLKEQYGFNFNVPSLDIFAPLYHQVIAPPTSFTIDSETQNLLGLYAQDQIRLGHWAFLLGGREDWASETGHDNGTGIGSSQFDRKFTWRAGAVYLFDNGLAPYASYATSFQPATGTDINGTAFKPTTGQQYEVGVKYQPPSLNSFITLAAFNLTQQNVLTADPTNSNFQTQSGETRSRGIELEGHASLTDNLNVIATYTYLDNVVTKSNTTTGAYTANTGKAPSGIPRNMASIWANYALPWQAVTGLQLGGGVRYVGSTFGDNADSFKVPSVALFDAAVHYGLGAADNRLKGWSAQVNASNLFDRTYVAGCTSTIACSYGLRRTILGGLKFTW